MNRSVSLVVAAGFVLSVVVLMLLTADGSSSSATVAVIMGGIGLATVAAVVYAIWRMRDR